MNRRQWTVAAVAAVVLFASLAGLVYLAARGRPAPTTAAPGGTPSTAAPTVAITPRSTVSSPPTVSPTPSPSAVTMPQGLDGRDLTVLPTARKEVALTFDGGAGAQGLDSILRTLADEGVAATFFLTGEFARAEPDAVRRIVRAGHLVGQHSMTHPHFTRLTDEEIRAELASAEHALAEAGADPRPWFRFPYGDRDERCVRLVNAAGYVPVRWTVDSLGWMGTSGGVREEKVVKRVMDALRPGAIVLMHLGANPTDGTTLDASALPRLIEALKHAGYAFTTPAAVSAGG